MVQRTFYALPHEAPAEVPEWEPAPDDVHTLKHGYNIADVHRLAHVALRRLVGGRLDYQSRYELAWSGIAECLYTAPDDQPPTPPDLIAAGAYSVSRHVQSEMHHHGRDRNNLGEEMPRFATYWIWMSAPAGSPERRVVEQTALWQIWAQLSDTHRQVLGALAVHGDYQAAAEALGRHPGTFNVHVSRARKAFLVLWHEGEEPSRIWGTDRRVSKRGSLADVDPAKRAARAVGRRTGRPEHELVHGKASTYTNHGCRCVPCTTAASEKARVRRRAAGAQARQGLTDEQLVTVRSRRAAGETLVSIAADLGCSDSYLSRLLSGTRKPVREAA